MKLDQRGAEGLTVLRYLVQLPEGCRAQASLFVNMEDYCVMGSSRPLVSVYPPPNEQAAGLHHPRSI